MAGSMASTGCPAVHGSRWDPRRDRVEPGRGGPASHAGGGQRRARRATPSGRPDAEAAGWAPAADAWHAARRPYDEAYARLRQAEAGFRTADREAARGALRAASATFSELGAVPLLRRAEDLARRARVAVHAARSRRAALDQLTKREGDVLELIAEGLTNPQIAERLFLSRKTVGIHVSRILDKLGVHTRGQAVAEAAGAESCPEDRAAAVLSPVDRLAQPRDDVGDDLRALGSFSVSCRRPGYTRRVTPGTLRRAGSPWVARGDRPSRGTRASARPASPALPARVPAPRTRTRPTVASSARDSRVQPHQPPHLWITDRASGPHGILERERRQDSGDQRNDGVLPARQAVVERGRRQHQQVRQGRPDST